MSYAILWVSTGKTIMNQNIAYGQCGCALVPDIGQHVEIGEDSYQVKDVIWKPSKGTTRIKVVMDILGF